MMCEFKQPMWPFGLYGAGMHDLIIREFEIGGRAALYEDSEACGYSALDDMRENIEIRRTINIPFRDWPLKARIIERLYRWTHSGQIRTLVVRVNEYNRANREAHKHDLY